MHLTVSIHLDDHRVVSGRSNEVDSLDPDYAAYVAFLVTQQVAIEAANVLAEGE